VCIRSVLGFVAALTEPFEWSQTIPSSLKITSPPPAPKPLSPNLMKIIENVRRGDTSTVTTTPEQDDQEQQEDIRITYSTCIKNWSNLRQVMSDLLGLVSCDSYEKDPMGDKYFYTGRQS